MGCTARLTPLPRLPRCRCADPRARTHAQTLTHAPDHRVPPQFRTLVLCVSCVVLYEPCAILRPSAIHNSPSLDSVIQSSGWTLDDSVPRPAFCKEFLRPERIRVFFAVAAASGVRPVALVCLCLVCVGPHPRRHTYPTRTHTHAPHTCAPRTHTFSHTSQTRAAFGQAGLLGCCAVVVCLSAYFCPRCVCVCLFAFFGL